MTAELPTNEYQEAGENTVSLFQKIQLEIPHVVISEQDRNDEGRLLASPDGPQSLLFESDWKIVRTPTFKKWFGNWQSSSSMQEICSKVIDKNGEPFRVYHETQYDFEEFDDNQIGSSTDSGYYGAGHYFSTNTGISGYYSGEEQFALFGFLNIKQPYFFDDEDGESLFLRYLLNRKNKTDAIAQAAAYLDVVSIQERITGLEAGEIEKHRDIPMGVNFDEYWEQKREEELEHHKQLLQTRRKLLENLPEIYNQMNQRYDGVICLKSGEKLSYQHYTEIVAFKSDQILITDKQDNRTNKKF